MSNKKVVVYPPDFDEKQKFDYDIFVRQSKVIFPDVEEWVIEKGVEAFIRLGDKELPVLSEEEIQEEKSKYEFTKEEYTTEVNEEDLVHLEPRFAENNLSSNISNNEGV